MNWKSIFLCLFAGSLAWGTPALPVDSPDEDGVRETLGLGNQEGAILIDRAETFSAWREARSQAASPPAFISPSERLLAYGLQSAERDERRVGRDFWWLLAAQLGAMVVDVEYSQHRFSLGAHEIFPWLPRDPTRKRMYLQFGASQALVGWVAHRCHARGHRRMARVLQSVAIGGHATGFTISRINATRAERRNQGR